MSPPIALRKLAILTVCVVWFGAASSLSTAAEPIPLIRLHAHNDYEHTRPLFDALDQGFCSIEADIFLVDGKLLVGHTRRSLRPERTLEALYLDPLKERVAQNGGRVYKNGPTITLFIDLKTAGSKTYAALRPVLEKYRGIISSFSPTGVERRAIDVVITGSCPRAEIAGGKNRLAAIDGKAGDLDSDELPELIPVISENWRAFFKWRGKGPIPEIEREKVRSFVKKAHDHKRRIRFWAAPDNPVCWAELFAADVDLLNTDRLAEAAQFVRSAQAKAVAAPGN